MVNVGILKKANVIIHIVQAIWAVVLMGILMASLVADGPASGAAKYMFTMCWLMIPCLIYLTQAPRFARTQMIAHPYWVIGVNSMISLLWFAAFVSVAAYTNGGISDGEKKEKDDKIKAKGGCALFPAGTGEAEKACTMNKTAVGLGVIMWFLWLGTTAIAGYAAWYFRQHSCSPFEDLTDPSHDIQETTKDAFSSNDEYALINKNREEDEEDGQSHRPISAYDNTSHRPISASNSSHNRTSSIGSYDGYEAHPGNPVPWGEGREPYDISGQQGRIPPAGTRIGNTPPHVGLDMPISPIDMDYTYRGAELR